MCVSSVRYFERSQRAKERKKKLVLVIEEAPKLPMDVVDRQSEDVIRPRVFGEVHPVYERI